MTNNNNPWWKDSPYGYEVLDEITDESEEARLYASYTPNNGIRLGILQNFLYDPEAGGQTEDGWDIAWREFDLTPEQAQKIGEALLRWAPLKHKLKSELQAPEK